MNVDLIAFLIFCICWLGYPLFAKFLRDRTDSLNHIVYLYRIDWMQNSIARKDRGCDAISIGNLMRTVSFSASTSILIIAALIPLLGYGYKLQIFLNKIPFAEHNSTTPVELKILLLVIIFIYAFFKYTWSLRQYNNTSIIILAAPVLQKKSPELAHLAKRNAKILTNASRHFSLGINSNYFGIAVLGWFLSPYLFIFFSILTFCIIFRREYLSKALNIISS